MLGRGMRLVLLAAVVLMMMACRQERPAAEGQGPAAVVTRYGAEPLTVELRLDRARLSIAEQLIVEVRAETSEEYGVKFGVQPEFPGFAVLLAKESTPELVAAGRIRCVLRYVLDPVVPGPVQVPALSVDAWKKADHEAAPITVSTEPQPVEITSLLAKDDRGEALSDIAPPVAKPVSPWLWATLALIAVAVALAGWYVWQRRQRLALVPPPPLPAHLVAYQALEQLIKGGLLAEGQVAAFYQALSDIVRHYIEQRFGLRAPERTTEEFLAELGGVGAGPMADPGHRSLLRDFLTHCDLVKFARHTPASTEAEEAVALCRRFIRETEPVATDPGPGGVA